ncbi:MAG: hypothetical protein KBB21_16225 [Nannocystaceae bacterium]|nr:hypothetical protein [Deltaproteobacteria bacterium]MBP7288177.1 hypothetical protein [Nannocystaceae bacterium]
MIAASSWDDGNAIALLQARDDTGAALWDTAITSDEDARIDVVGLAVDADDSYYLLLQSDAACGRVAFYEQQLDGADFAA